MKRLNFNIKDRKVLTLGLCLVVVCVFTLTIAYAALNAVLTISGNARVSAADWDIYLNNPRVTNGSATTNVPVIKTSSTLEFETTLNMPGDFYEFVVDVVNAGDIDAMIENVVKTPELTADQAKFLKYEVSYQNGESITTKQLLAKDTTMPIKVRIEYRKDLSNSDLPTGQVVLDLALTLEYIQSDGTGSSVKDNGIVKVATANGNIEDIGTIVTIGSEQFYTIGTEDDNVKLLSMYNLYVGNSVDEDWNYIPLTVPTGMQDSTSRGFVDEEFPFIGVIYSTDSTQYINNYKAAIERFGVEVVEARLITKDELSNQDTLACSETNYTCSSSPYEWIYSITYWVSSDDGNYWVVDTEGMFMPQEIYTAGVRPVIVVSKSNF